jgi:hypothetical protein
MHSLCIVVDLHQTVNHIELFIVAKERQECFQLHTLGATDYFVLLLAT